MPKELYQYETILHGQKVIVRRFEEVNKQPDDYTMEWSREIGEDGSYSEPTIKYKDLVALFKEVHSGKKPKH